MPKTFQFPVWLQGTKEQQAAEAQAQEIARAFFGRGHLSDAERLVGRGALLEKTARANLEAAGDNVEAVNLSMSQLADACAMQGRFSDAAEIHPDEERTKYFESIVTALQMPDEEKCPCEDITAKLSAQGKVVADDADGTEIAITPRYEVARIYSSAHNGIVSLVGCQKCPHLNARPLRSRLLNNIDAMAQNAANVKGLRMISDAQVLAKQANG